MDGRATYSTDDAAVLLVGTAHECCKAANEGEFGDKCLVVDSRNMEVCWEWFSTGTWHV